MCRCRLTALSYSWSCAYSFLVGSRSQSSCSDGTRSVAATEMRRVTSDRPGRREAASRHCCPPIALRAVRLSEPHFDDQPCCSDAECSERSYDYAKDKLMGFAPFRLYPCVLKARILLRKPLLSLDALFSRQVSHVADPKFVPDLGSTEALKASAILVRYCHLFRFASARTSPVRFPQSNWTGDRTAPNAWV